MQRYLFGFEAPRLEPASIDVAFDLPRPGFGACLGFERGAGDTALSPHLGLPLTFAAFLEGCRRGSPLATAYHGAVSQICPQKAIRGAVMRLRT